MLKQPTMEIIILTFIDLVSQSNTVLKKGRLEQEN